MSERRTTALQVRHRLMASLRERGALTEDGRKTHRRNPRKPPSEAPYRVAVLLPPRWLVPPGRTGTIGVMVEPDPISGPLAVVEHRDLEWACRQMAKFLLSVSNDERIITASVVRDGVSRTQQIVIGYDGAAMPRGSAKTWWVTA